MTFRAATTADTETLYEWRHHAESEDWFARTPTSVGQHRGWLLQRLKNPLVKLRIWVEGQQPVGMVRVDSNGELAFHAFNDAVADRMLAQARNYTTLYGGRLKAVVNPEDTKTCDALLRAGFREHRIRFFTYRSPQ